MTRAQKLAERFEASTYYESSIGEVDVEILENFMLENRISPDEIVFLSQMEAGWADSTLLEIKAKLDGHKIPNMLWFSTDEDEERLVWSIQE